jgi:hypothetical protein
MNAIHVFYLQERHQASSQKYRSTVFTKTRRIWVIRNTIRGSKQDISKAHCRGKNKNEYIMFDGRQKPAYWKKILIGCVTGGIAAHIYKVCSL